MEHILKLTLRTAQKTLPVWPPEFKPRVATLSNFLRLTLSSFRDGSGQVVRPIGGTMSGFRDYERSLAAVLGVTTPEGMGIFDVLVSMARSPLATARQPNTDNS